MAIYNSKEIEYSKLDEKRLRSASKRLFSALSDLNKLGCEVFGGSGSLDVRYYHDPEGIGDDIGALILVTQNGNVSGGCGASGDFTDGYLRGE